MGQAGSTRGRVEGKPVDWGAVLARLREARRRIEELAAGLEGGDPAEVSGMVWREVERALDEAARALDLAAVSLAGWRLARAVSRLAGAIEDAWGEEAAARFLAAYGAAYSLKVNQYQDVMDRKTVEAIAREAAELVAMVGRLVEAAARKKGGGRARRLGPGGSGRRRP